MRAFEHVSREHLIGPSTYPHGDTTVLHVSCTSTCTRSLDSISSSDGDVYLDGRLEHPECIRARAQEPRFRCRPVDHVPDVLDVRCFAVQVLHVVSQFVIEW
jgi:hypothetical protein